MNRSLLTVLALFLSHISFAQSVPAYVPTSGLAAWYSFDGSAYDSSGNLNNGIIYGATLTTDRYETANKAYLFNGTSNYIEVPASATLNLNTSLSVSAWVRTTDYTGGTANYQIMYRGGAAVLADPYMLYCNAGQVRMRRDINTGTTVTQTGFPSTLVNVPPWHMLTGTYDHTTGALSIYLDDTLMAQTSAPGTMTYATSAMKNIIGAAVVGSGIGQFFNGKIDDMGVWNRALSYCEVKALYLASMNPILAHPAPLSVISGGTATFSIHDTGTGATYKWQQNAGSGFADLPASLPFSGVNTRTLVINPASVAMNGHTYRCVRTVSVCSTADTSTAATLNVSVCLSPIITQPADQSVIAGTTAVFTMHDTVTGATYQWQRNSGSGFVNLPATTPFAGVTTKVMTINPASAAMNGNRFRCVRYHPDCGTADTSSAAMLNVATVSSMNIESDAANDIHIFPNPNDGKFSVRTGKTNETFEVMIFDATGRVIYKTISRSKNDVLQFDIKNKLSPGSYVIRLKCATEILSTRFVVNTADQ